MGTEIKCLFGYILLRPLNDNNNTSGIISPASVSIPSSKGVIVSVGTGSPDGAGATIPMQLKVGETVHFDPSKKREIEVDGEILYYMDQLAVFAVVEEKNG